MSRQIALLLSLLPPSLSPTEAIAKLVADQEDRDISSVRLLDRGAFEFNNKYDGRFLSAGVTARDRNAS